MPRYYRPRSKSLRKKRSRKKVLIRKKNKSRKSFSNTLNQMGGFIRDSSSQFFKGIKKSLTN